MTDRAEDKRVQIKIGTGPQDCSVMVDGKPLSVLGLHVNVTTYKVHVILSLIPDEVHVECDGVMQQQPENWPDTANFVSRDKSAQECLDVLGSER